MICSMLSSVFVVVGVALLFDLSPVRITEDLMTLLTPKESLKNKVKRIRHPQKNRSLYAVLKKMQVSLTATGKARQFSVVCFASLALFGLGVLVSLFIHNVYILPVLSLALAVVPFLYIQNTRRDYEKQMQNEMETALSIITTSYMRSDDIVSAIAENLPYIKPPLRSIFESFVGDVTLVSSDIRRALYALKSKGNDAVFEEWIDTLIQCQNDRTMKDTLLSIVAKLTDIRIVNNELKTMLSSAKNEYWVMVALVIGNVPLLYCLNEDWFRTLVFTDAGKIVLAICGAVIFVTSLLMQKYTQPIEYKG